MVSELFNKICEIVKADKNVVDFGMYEDTEWISLTPLFALDEDECMDALRKLCSDVFAQCDDIKKFEINEYFCEVAFYF